MIGTGSSSGTACEDSRRWRKKTCRLEPKRKNKVRSWPQLGKLLGISKAEAEIRVKRVLGQIESTEEARAYHTSCGLLVGRDVTPVYEGSPAGEHISSSPVPLALRRPWWSVYQYEPPASAMILRVKPRKEV